MKKITFLFLLVCFVSNAQVFDVVPILNNGNTDKYINIVIMGDGFTASEQDLFITKATEISTYIFQQQPFSNYKNYFNVFAIKVISLESGVKHPSTSTECATVSPFVPTSNPNNYFNTRFDYGGIHRLVVPTNNAKISQVLAANFPNYDQVLILGNSPYYGGSGGSYATATLNVASKEVALHEMGHSFANLADEYWAGDIYAAELPNMTVQTNPLLVKWKNWMGTTNIGIYSHCCDGISANWKKPTSNNCKMEYLNKPFCNVCKQTIVERIHNLVNPIVDYLPVETAITTSASTLDFSLTQLMLPIPNTLAISWKLNGATLSTTSPNYQLDVASLANGNHVLTTSVIDNSTLINVDNHSATHFNYITWNINKTALSTSVFSQKGSFTYQIYPNPVEDNFTIDLESNSNLISKIDLFTENGKFIRNILDNNTLQKISKEILISELSTGVYILKFSGNNGEQFSEKVIKK